MEIETTVTNINGSIFVRIPSNMAKYFNIKKKTKAKVQDLSSNEAKITFIIG